MSLIKAVKTRTSNILLNFKSLVYHFIFDELQTTKNIVNNAPSFTTGVVVFTAIDIDALLALNDLVGPEFVAFEACDNALERIFGPTFYTIGALIYFILYGFSLLFCKTAYADGGGGVSSSRIARSHATAQSWSKSVTERPPLASQPGSRISSPASPGNNAPAPISRYNASNSLPLQAREPLSVYIVSGDTISSVPTTTRPVVPATPRVPTRLDALENTQRRITQVAVNSTRARDLVPAYRQPISTTSDVPDSPQRTWEDHSTAAASVVGGVSGYHGEARLRAMYDDFIARGGFRGLYDAHISKHPDFIRGPRAVAKTPASGGMGAIVGTVTFGMTWKWYGTEVVKYINPSFKCPS